MCWWWSLTICCWVTCRYWCWMRYQTPEWGFLWPPRRETVHPARFGQANLDPSPVHLLPDWEHWWDRWLVKGWHQFVTFCSCVEGFSKTAAVMGRCRHGCCSRGGWRADSRSRVGHSDRRCTRGHLIAEVQWLTLSCYLLELNMMMNSSDHTGSCPTIERNLRRIQSLRQFHNLNLVFTF